MDALRASAQRSIINPHRRDSVSRPGEFGQQVLRDSTQSTCDWKTWPNWRATALRTASIDGGGSTSRSRLVTSRSAMPQGTISWKSRRSGFTLNANPCEVMPRAMWTPIAAIFFS